jgi:type IV secretory pathway VirB10-like protein
MATSSDDGAFGGYLIITLVVFGIVMAVSDLSAGYSFFVGIVVATLFWTAADGAEGFGGSVVYGGIISAIFYGGLAFFGDDDKKEQKTVAKQEIQKVEPKPQEQPKPINTYTPPKPQYQQPSAFRQLSQEESKKIQEEIARKREYERRQRELQYQREQQRQKDTQKSFEEQKRKQTSDYEQMKKELEDEFEEFNK